MEDNTELDYTLWLLDACLQSAPGYSAAWSLPCAEHVHSNPAITEKQLRALSKKHLLMMLRDAQQALALEREEKEYLRMAYQAMLRSGR